MGFSDPYNFFRFTVVHEGTTAGSYENALREIHAGRKRSHWMWYIFPQIIGISVTPTSRYFALTSFDEAKAYLQHDYLRVHLVEISQAVLESSTKTAFDLMRSPDDMKLHACMTLFMRADPEGRVFDWQKVLDKYYEGRPHAQTDEILRQQSESAR